jgi:uncharacterized protein (TIGR02466 family)|tara:strand:- start:233 stop:820 length:588 start_codon:yes stop_codon:yes gene_type:complete
MNRDLLFPTPIYTFDIGSFEFNKYLQERIIKWQSEDKGMTRTNVNGWHSLDNMHTKEEYKPLVEDFYKAQRMIYKEENYNSEPYLGSMWANINFLEGFNKQHMHPNSLWSGVYYVKTSENCGDLIIEDPKSVGLMMMPNREEPIPKYAAREIHYKPVAGRLIMFPAYLNHCVEANKSNDIRISISFNFLQKGMFV